MTGNFAINRSYLKNRVGTVSAAAAGFTIGAAPHGIEMFYGACHKGQIRGQNPGLEVSGCFPLHTDAGTRQIRRTKIHLSHVKYHHFEMNSWT